MKRLSELGLVIFSIFCILAWCGCGGTEFSEGGSAMVDDLMMLEGEVNKVLIQERVRYGGEDITDKLLFAKGHEWSRVQGGEGDAFSKGGWHAVFQGGRVYFSFVIEDSGDMGFSAYGCYFVFQNGVYTLAKDRGVELIQ